MAGASDEIRIRIITETKQAVKELAAWGAGVLAAYRSAQKIVQVMVEMEQAFFEQEKAEAKLSAVLMSTGNAVGYTTNQLAEMATQMQRTTVFGDETVMNAQAVMATFTKIGHDVFPDAMEAAANMSTVMGQDLQASVVQLGKALNDPITGATALRRVGVSLTEQQMEQIKVLMSQNDLLGAQKLILGELSTEFGGAAKAMGDTAYGASVKLTNAMGDLKEEIGRGISSGMKPFREWLTRVVQGLTDAKKKANDLMDALEGTFKDPKTPIEVIFDQLAAVDKQLALTSKDWLQHNEQYAKVLESQRASLIQQLRYHETVAAYQKVQNDANLKAMREAEDLAIYLAKVAEGYAKTEEGKRDALMAEIAYWEAVLPDAVATRGQVEAILKSLKEQLPVEKAILDARTNMADYMRRDREATEETADARQNLSDFLRADRESMEAIQKAARGTVGPVTEIADLWGDADQYTKETKENLGVVHSILGDVSAESQKVTDNISEWQTIVSAAGKALEGDFVGALQEALSMAGPEGKLAASIIGFVEDLVDQLNAAFHGGEGVGGSEFSTSLAEGLSGLFADAMGKSDWKDFRKAMSDKIKGAIAETIVESAFLKPYIEEFTNRIGRWMAVPSDRRWDQLVASYQNLMHAAGNANDMYTTITAGLASAETGVVNPNAHVGLTAGGASKSIVVNFNGPTFGDEPTMRRYVVGAVTEATRGY